MGHITVEAYCIFCREAFYMSQDRRTNIEKPSDVEPIESDLFCFFNLPLTAQTQPQLQSTSFLFRVNLSSGNWKLRNPSFFKVLRENHVDLCFDSFRSSCPSADCDTRDTLGLCHPDCLRLAKRALVPLTGEKLVEIAQILRPIAPWRVILDARFHTQRPPPLPDVSNFGTDTSLAKLLNRIKDKLPPEITLQILGDITGLPKYIFAAQATVEYLSRHLLDITIGSSSVRSFRETSNLKQLIIRTTETLEGDCILHLESSRSTSTGSTGKLIPLDQAQIMSGFQVAFGTYGVVDFRLVYSDGATSQWLSSVKGRWVANYSAYDLRNVEMESDGNKLVDICLGGNQSPDSMRLLWDTDTCTSPNIRSAYFLLEHRRVAIRSGVGYQLARYLSLDNIRSLTLCFTSAACCIQTDNDARRALGTKEEMFCMTPKRGIYFVPEYSSVTYFLADDEVITSMCFLTTGDNTSESGVTGPYIVALTSRARTLFYAPYLLFRSPSARFSSYTAAPTTRIRGLFTDPVYKSESALRSIGATYEVKDDSWPSDKDFFSIPNPHHPVPPSINDWGEEGGFLNVTNFRNVNIIKLQRRLKRCVGLKISRHSGEIDVLGQWDGSAQKTITTIYESSQGPLKTLDFKFKNVDDSGRYTWVRHLEVNRPGPAGDPHDSLRVDTLDAEVAWYFSYPGDQVEFWNGTMAQYEMPRTSYLDAIPVQ